MSDRQKSVLAFVEIPRGSRNKYEFDAARGGIRLDRVLYSPLHYPADYGFVRDTLAEDGDHLDVLIFTYESTFPGCLVEVRPIGMLDMRDENSPPSTRRWRRNRWRSTAGPGRRRPGG